MSLLNPPKPLTGTITSDGQPAFKAVNTMMNKPLDQDTIDKMTAAVTCRAIDLLSDVGSFTAPPSDGIHMLAVDRKFKYGEGKEIIAFTDGGKGTTGQDLKYVKFFYWYDMSKGNIKSNDKTYSYSVEKARNFWNDKVVEGYTRFDVDSEKVEETTADKAKNKSGYVDEKGNIDPDATVGNYQAATPNGETVVDVKVVEPKP